MEGITVFRNNQFGAIRAIEINSQPWFVAKDICEVLELSNPTMAVSRLDEDEVTKLNLGSLSGHTNLVNESGLYCLVLGSRKPEARQFKRWITSEVLPTIRKSGGYVKDEETFLDVYFPFIDDMSKEFFRGTLSKIREQNALIVKQQQEIQHKEDVIISLVDDVEIADKRQILNRVVRYKGANFQERWSELYKQFGMKYHIDLNKRIEAYNEEPCNSPKIRKKIDYIDKVMNKVPELYEIACKLYESDIKELADQILRLR